jgi:hypothetical protein
LVRRLLTCGTIAWLALSGVAIASEYHGQVTFGGVPVPGTTVTVTATQGSKKVVAISDAQGVFSFPDLADGTWSLDIEMTGFAPVKQDVTIAPNAAPGVFELKLLTLDQIRAAAKPVKIDVTAPTVAVSAPAPQPAAPAGGLPATPAKAPAAKPQTTTATTAAPAPAAPPPDTASSQPSDGLLINGSVNNAATSQYSLAQAFGNTRNGRSLYTTGFNLRLDNSSFDAKTYSLAGLDSPKPQHNNMTVGFNFQGPLKIPHLFRNGPNFYVEYDRTQNSSYTTTPALVPTLAQETGNFSQQTTAIYAPTTGLSSACLGAGVTPGLAFTGNIIPAACISSVAHNYLTSATLPMPFNFYPMPNVTGGAAYNYQIPLPSSTHADSYRVQLSRPIRSKDYAYGGFNVTSSRSANTNIFGFNDKNNSLNIGANAYDYHRFTQRLTLSASYNFSRSRTRLLPFFASRDQDVSFEVGITDNDRDQAYYGPPSLGFSSSGIFGFSDASSSNNRSETNQLNLELNWNHLRHNVKVGGDFRRQESNYLSEQNPEGSFTFTGAATQSGGAGGSDFADFLLGIPDTSNISFGNADKYLRQSVYDAYALDDFRVNPELSINAGVRWEYGAPVTELKNRLVNLDIAPGFTGEQAVLASNPVGPLTGQSYPTSLVRPDKIGVAPNVSIAWRPISGSSLLVRSSYQIAHDTSVYQQAALAMAQQAPLATSLSISSTSACPLTLATAFTPPSCFTTPPATDTFALDPNFRVGYLQTWQLQVQRDLPASLQLTATYNGIKGTHGVQEFLPNTYAPGATNPCPSCASGYVYRTSGGDSTREAGSVQLRRRLRNGLTASALYTYSKSLDDDYALSGQGSVTNYSSVAQNWLDLKGQRGLSTTDQRHVLNAALQYTTGMGLGGHTLLSGWRGLAYKEWTILTNITLASGLPQTPLDPGSVPGTGFSGILRPNTTGQPIHASTAPGFFLNSAAFAPPASGMWGDARRDSIPGPTQFTLNGSMVRNFRIHNRYNLSAEIDAINPLNHVTYSSWNTTVGSKQFGSAEQANGMRSITAVIRLRF